MYRPVAHWPRGSRSQERDEFPALLVNMLYFTKLWQVFTGLDGDQDRRIDFAEMQHGLRALGVALSTEEAVEAFGAMDTNRGGVVLFDGTMRPRVPGARPGAPANRAYMRVFIEFCLWWARRQCPGYDAAAAVPSPRAAGKGAVVPAKNDKGDVVDDRVMDVDFKEFDAVRLARTAPENAIPNVSSHLCARAAREGDPGAGDRQGQTQGAVGVARRQQQRRRLARRWVGVRGAGIAVCPAAAHAGFLK